MNYPPFLYYLLIINLISFLTFGIDKRRAKQKRFRIPEATLLGLALLGGSPAAWIGMRCWHHKTNHPKFKYGIPAIFILQLFLLLFLLISSINC